jgi:transposase
MDIEQRSDDDVAQLQHRIRTEKDAAQRDRYRVVVLAIEGHPTKEIQQRLERSRGFVQRWAYVYRDHGLDAIAAAPCGGSSPKLDAAQQVRFIERFKAGPTDADAGVCRLGGQEAVRILQQEFGVAYSLTTAYDLLHRHGLSCLRPRPKHRKSDEAAQQQWLDDAPLLSGKCVINIPISGSKCGSRTKHASASRAR